MLTGEVPRNDSSRLGNTGRLVAAAVALAAVLLAAITIVVLANPSWFYANPWLHGALESYSQIIGIIIAAICFTRFYYQGRTRDLLVALAFLVVAIIDLPHSLTYPGILPGVVGRSDLSAYFWLAARLSQAGLLLAGALAAGVVPLPRRRHLLLQSLLTTVLAAGTLTLFLFLHSFDLPLLVRPQGWHAPQGSLPTVLGINALTPLKIGLESLAALGFTAALALFLRQYRRRGDPLAGWLTLALVPMVYSELFFVLYPTVYGTSWYMGHLLKVLSYLVLAVWLPLESVRLQAELAADKEALVSAYGEIGRIVGATREQLTPLLQAILDLTVHTLKAAGGCILLQNGEEIICSPEAETRALHGECRALSDQALRHGTQLLVTKGTPAYALAAIPLQSDGGPLGVLCLARPLPGQFTDTERSMLAVFAAHASAGIRQVQHYQQRLQDQERRARFLTIVAHELKTPLTVIRGYAEHILGIIRPGYPVPADASSQLKQDLQVLGRQAKRMTRLVDELLDFTRLSSGTLELVCQDLDLASWLPPLLEELRSLHQDHPIKLTAAGPLPVCVDEDRLAQVMSNLLANAANYSPEGSTIAVALSRAGEQAVITVADQGRGIQQQDLDRVFAPFYRSEAEDGSYHRQGIGLGLYVSQAIIQRHSGQIRAQSEPGVGSLFEVFLPLANPTAPGA